MNTDKNYYTELSDWEIHWKNFKAFKIKDPHFDEILKDLPPSGDFIEIGGFPGLYSIYFKKKFDYNVHLLDYIVIPEIIQQMEMINEVPIGSIKLIKSDFFTYNNEKKYNIVFSYGFIEHFENTMDVIKRHVNLLADAGKLFIMLPNLKGISGWFLKLTDKRLFYKHNLKSMNLQFLTEVCNEIGLRELKVFYFGKPHIWINVSSPVDSRVSRFIIKYLNGILQRIKIRNQTFSPFIVIKATK